MARTRVRGHTRKDGTRVKAHARKTNKVALPEGWVKDAGWESPGWYNITYFNEQSPFYLIASNSSDEHEGTDHENSRWTVGSYDAGSGGPGEQRAFQNRKAAERYAEEMIRRNTP